MINSNDLRRTNLVQYNGCVFSVYSIEGKMPRKEERFDNKEVITLFDGGLISVPIDEIEPIPLTEDFLLKMGFKKYQYFPDEHSYKLENYVIHSNGWFCKISGENTLIILNEEVNHVHTLQNIYYALENQELKIK